MFMSPYLENALQDLMLKHWDEFCESRASSKLLVDCAICLLIVRVEISSSTNSKNTSNSKNEGCGQGAALIPPVYSNVRY